MYFRQGFGYHRRNYPVLPFGRDKEVRRQVQQPVVIPEDIPNDRVEIH